MLLWICEQVGFIFLGSGIVQHGGKTNHSSLMAEITVSQLNIYLPALQVWTNDVQFFLVELPAPI